MDQKAKEFKPTQASFVPAQQSKYQDDAILSISGSAPAQRKEWEADAKVKRDQGGRRELRKADWINDSNVKGTNANLMLNDLDDKKAFNQFEGRRTTYNEDMYNVGYDMSKLSKEQIETAEKI